MQNPPQQPEDKGTMSTLVYIALLLWVIAGIAAFVLSLFCFGKSGTPVDKVIGLVIAVLFGPFYWIYYGVSKKYCR
jgi:hypothetical protein